MKRGKKAETDLRHSKACTCAECRGPSNTDAVAAIKEAISHAPSCECLICVGKRRGKGKPVTPGKNGRYLTIDEVVELITKPIHLCPPSKRRGPTPKRTQYEAAFERRDRFLRAVHHRLFRLPFHHKLQRNDADYMLGLVKRVVEFLGRKGMRITSGAVERAWVKVNPRHEQPERTTIWRYLSKLQK